MLDAGLISIFGIQLHLELSLLVDKLLILSFEFFYVPVVKFLQRPKLVQFPSHSLISHVAIVSELLELELKSSVPVVCGSVLLLL